MRWLPRCALVASFALLPAALGAQQPAAPQPVDPRPARVVTRDSLVDPIVGVYVSSADPKGTIGVSAVGYGRVLVTGSGWEAQGWYASGEFVGAWQRPAADADSAVPRSHGWLRFGRNPDASLSATFTDPSDGAPRHEAWKWVNRFGGVRRAMAGPSPGATPTAPPTPAANRDAGVQGAGEVPKIGEYTYVEALPEAITKVPPAYPDDARRKRIEGTVMVQALVGLEGTVRDTRVVKSIPELDAAAVAAVMQWNFKPAMSGGKPVAVWVAVPIKFSLH